MTQQDLTETECARGLLDQLLSDSRLYMQSKDYKALLNFVVKLHSFAPFNAMLLQVQKPGLTYAASAVDWRARFGRTIKAGARPLLIIREVLSPARLPRTEDDTASRSEVRFPQN